MNDTPIEPRIALARLWRPAHFNGDPYKTRSELFAIMEVGDSVRMWAVTANQYASIRSSAYGFARSRQMRFRTKRVNPEVIHVLRES